MINNIINNIIIVTGAFFFNQSIWLIFIWTSVWLFMTLTSIDLIALGSLHPAYIIGWNILHDVVAYGVTSYRQNFMINNGVNGIFTVFFILYTIIGFLTGLAKADNPHLAGINYPWIMAGVFILRFLFLYFLYRKYKIKLLIDGFNNENNIK